MEDAKNSIFKTGLESGRQNLVWPSRKDTINRMSDVKLQPGCFASVPLSGLCKVVEIKETEMLGKNYRFYVLASDENDYVVKVPQHQLENMGIRPVMTSDQMHDLLEEPVDVDSPRDRPHLLIKKWTRWLRSGEAGARKRVLAELAAIQNDGGKLSKRQSELWDKVHNNFLREITQVLELSPEQAVHRLAHAVGLASPN